jgi:hypothetical protein
MNEEPNDEAIKELLARFLMEFGGEWTDWSKWSEDTEFFSWYCKWCSDNFASGGIESVPKMRVYVDVVHTEYRLRVSEAGKEFLSCN